MAVEKTSSERKALTSIGIAGSWGYIGQRFFEAARQLGLDIYVHDPSIPPEHLDLQGVTVLSEMDDFYRLPVDLYHLALHPQHRWAPLDLLVERARQGERITVLCEKPVVLPERPNECHEVLGLAQTAGLRLFYDFPELFDPQTLLIQEFLSRFQNVKIREMWLQRGKDREDAANPRNYKVMVPIQYQETVHCLAFMLDMLSRSQGESALRLKGITVAGESQPYDPPNPQCYPRAVDGKCVGEVRIGGVTVHLETNFKKGAAYQKRRRIAGEADGVPFTIEADLLEGHKYLRINGEDQNVPPDRSSYISVLRQLWDWRNALSQNLLNQGLFPNARMACTAYLLSAALWEACFTRSEVTLNSVAQAFQIAENYGLHSSARQVAAR